MKAIIASCLSLACLAVAMPQDAQAQYAGAPRTFLFNPALDVCIRVPQVIAITAAAVLELCDRLVDKVNRYLLSDLAVCAELSMATVRCGVYNVRVNLSDVADAVQKQAYAADGQAQVARAVEIVRRVMPRIWRRMRRATSAITSSAASKP